MMGAPTDDGGTPIANYTVEMKQDDGDFVEVASVTVLTYI